MHRFPIPLAYETTGERPKSRFPRTIGVVVLAVVLAPLLVEGAVLCYGQWCEVMGNSNRVRTPLLDSVQENVQSANSSIWETVTHQFQRVPWNPKVVLPIAAVIMALAMAMLRR
jgi:hypothetical protein